MNAVRYIQKLFKREPQLAAAGSEGAAPLNGRDAWRRQHALDKLTRRVSMLFVPHEGQPRWRRQLAAKGYAGDIPQWHSYSKRSKIARGRYLTAARGAIAAYKERLARDAELEAAEARARAET